MDACAAEFGEVGDGGHVGLPDHAADGDEDFVEVFVVLAVDFDDPLLAVVVEDDLLD